MADIFREPWATLQTNTGISSETEIDFVPHGATARDGSYPEVGMSESLKIINNGTRNVMTANPDGNWGSVACAWDRIGAVAGIHANYPNWFDASVPLRIYTDHAVDGDSPQEGMLITLLRTIGLFPLTLGVVGGNVELFCRRWNDPNIDVDSYALPDLTGKRVRFQIDMKPGTMDAGATTVADDGYLTVTMIDLDTDESTTIYDYQDTSIWLTTQGENGVVPENNHLCGAAVAYFQLFAPCELFVIQTLDSTPPDPEPGELMTAEPSEPCCGDTAGVGPLLPSVAPDWTGACEGGGTVPTAVDLTDAENWDD